MDREDSGPIPQRGDQQYNLLAQVYKVLLPLAIYLILMFLGILKNKNSKGEIVEAYSCPEGNHVVLKYVGEGPTEAELRILEKLRGQRGMVQLVEWVYSTLSPWTSALVFQYINATHIFYPSSAVACRKYLTSWLEVYHRDIIYYFFLYLFLYRELHSCIKCELFTAT